MAKKEKYIQVGVTSIRDPFTGEFIQSTPLYIKVKKGEDEVDEHMARDLMRVFGHQLRDYVAGCREAGAKI